MNADLGAFQNADYSPGAGLVKRTLWYCTNAILFDSWLMPLYPVKATILRWFGARVGRGSVIKPRVNIKYPWRLRLGDNVWIGEGAWIDNLADVGIGDNACLSQGCLLLTGNHDYKDPRFTLFVNGITIEECVWVGARSTVCPGVRMGRNSVLTVGSVLQVDTEPNGVYSGMPAVLVRQRRLRGAGERDRSE
jgi:putative colanic acid biosynthesis acetyltransferase WcaF